MIIIRPCFLFLYISKTMHVIKRNADIDCQNSIRARQEFSSGEELDGDIKHIGRKPLRHQQEKGKKAAERDMSEKGGKNGGKQKTEKGKLYERKNEEQAREVFDGNKSAEEEQTAGSMGKKEKTNSDKKEILLYIYIIGAFVVALTALTLYMDYSNKFKEINNHKEFLDTLKEMKADFPDLKSELDTVKNDLNSVHTSIEPLKNDMKETEKKVKVADSKLHNMEVDINQFNKSMDQFKGNIKTQSDQSVTLSDKFNELEPRFSKLARNVADTEEKVLPSIEKQTTLIKDVSDTSSNVVSLKLSVETLTTTITGINTTMIDLQPKVNYVNEAVSKSKYLEERINEIDKTVESEQEKVTLIQTNITDADKNTTNLSEKVQKMKLLVELSGDKQTELWEKQNVLKECIKTNDENIAQQNTKLENIKTDVSTFETDFSNTTKNLNSVLTNLKYEVEKTENKWLTLRKETVDFKKEFDESSKLLDERIKEEEDFTAYVRDKLPSVAADVNTIKGSVSIPWCSIMDVLEVAAIVFIVIHMFYPQYSVGVDDTMQVIDYKHSDDEDMPSTPYQRPRSVLDEVHRAAVLEDKICIVSFYSDTQKLHRSLVTSAVELSRRGKTMGIIQHLVKGDTDILTIPKARYILVFVDYNERNVILENTGQDLGDKKVVTVKAAQKIGADVFVTYVRDKGSNNLFPGHLYNIELSAFTSHPVLKRLENRQRCFSVYDTFNNSQREHIGKAIR